MKIQLSPWQTKVWEDETRYAVINCGRRAGKSFLVAPRALHFAANHPKSVVWYVAPTYKQAKQIMWSMLKDVTPEHMIAKKNETELTLLLKNGSSVMLKGAEDPDSLRGVRIDFCVFDECAFIDRWEDVWKVIRPTLVDSKAAVWFISTPNGKNHFKDLAERQATDTDWSYHHYTSYNNPFIDPLEINAAKKEMDEDSFAQEFLGEFRTMAGLIYKEFERETHMVDVPDLTGFTHFRTLDFGFSHKTALGYFAVNPDGTAIYMYDGLYRSELDTEQLGNTIKVKDGTRFISGAWADSAQPQLIEDLDKKGVHFEPVEKGPDSVIKGIANVAQLLKVRADTGKPTLMFAKHLDWVADEAEQYRWMQNKNENSHLREMPLKREDDAMDMIRYFAMSYNKPVKKYHQPVKAMSFGMPS